MRVTRWIALAAGIVPLLLLAGCSGTTIYDIDGQFGVGTLRFVYDDNNTWALRHTVIEVVEEEDLIYISGYDSNDELWAYRGPYDRTDNRVTAMDMPERLEGNNDTMDLTLQFARNRVSGTVTNWIRDDDGDVLAVGAVPVSGSRLSSYVPRPLSTVATTERAPKLQ